MRKVIHISSFLFLVTILGVGFQYYRNTHIQWSDFKNYSKRPGPIGLLEGNPLDRLGIGAEELWEKPSEASVRFLRKTQYLNNAHAVVTHTIDDTNRFVATCIDVLDKYGIKATVAVNTEKIPTHQLWSRLNRATRNGHEIGSHSRRHQCQWPDTYLFCFRAYTDYEINGSRDDILNNTDQPHVWSWVYPCGNCVEFDFVQRKLARAGYFAARIYPGEADDNHNVPNLQTYAQDPYKASYTQVVQKIGGIAKTGRTNIEELNAKFDEVYKHGGIYHFVSHPAWLDYGTDKFYEQHLDYISRRSNIWYVPMGPLYTFKKIVQETEVWPLSSGNAKARFVVYNEFDPKVYPNSITLEFFVSGIEKVISNGNVLKENNEKITDRWDTQYLRRTEDRMFVTVKPNTILEFR